MIQQEPSGIFPAQMDKLPINRGVSSLIQAKDMFAGLGMKIDSSGLIDQNLNPDQIDQLVQWSKSVAFEGHQMPTAEAFFGKTLLAASLWPQRQDGKTTYLAGKGWGTELALQGHVMGRKKNESFTVPIRSHSDFECYNVRDFSRPNGQWPQGHPPIPTNFKKVLWLIEAYPPSVTKLLRDIPSDLFDETSEVVDLEGYKFLIPKLELLFVDKLVSPEEGSAKRLEGFDHELLASAYQLDKNLAHQYLEKYYVEPWKKAVTSDKWVFYEAKHKEMDRIFESQANNADNGDGLTG